MSSVGTVIALVIDTLRDEEPADFCLSAFSVCDIFRQTFSDIILSYYIIIISFTQVVSLR